MYKNILIANRSDCAARLIHGVHAVGARAVLAVAREDRLPLPERLADDVIVTGEGRDAFEDAQNLIEAAHQKSCEAILPGWGFVSESAVFAQQCRAAGLHFVGPSTAHLELFGDKLRTLQTLSEPLGLASTFIAADDPEFERRIGESTGGWALKRRTGGGGRGVFLFDSARKLLAHRFDDRSGCYAEPLVRGRHIEFQVFGDGRGRARVLGIRDCSKQIRCQKQLEFHVPFGAETWLRPFANNVERIFGGLRYKSWGTLETLVDAAGRVHLLEVNPRLQVEHGVTEMACGVDLVRAALMLECGHSMDDALHTERPVDTESIKVVEQRYYMRETGVVRLPAFEGFDWPHSPFDGNPDFRLETGYLPGDVVSGLFDGMTARMIGRAPRDEHPESFPFGIATP